MGMLKCCSMFMVIVSSIFISVVARASKAIEGSVDPEVVKSVDLQRYSGLWHEVAHAPNFFQRGCLQSTAEYQVISSDSISVYNSCIKENGSKSDISGIARVMDLSVPAKLKVKFNFFARGDYWIVGLDDKYQWAVVSGPRKKSLFILSRVVPMDSDLLRNILADLKQKKFNVDDLVFGRY